jgi:hypothetical protein
VRGRFARWAIDAGERCAKTAVQVMLAQMAASGTGWVDAVQDVSTLQRGAIAALGAVASLATSALSRWAGSPASASLVD